MFDKYLAEISRLHRAGNATEHSYRSALQVLLTQLLKDVQVTNEPKRQKCGAPDYILTRRKIDIGYIEAKDIGVDLDRVERGGKDDDQWKRYTESLDNIILTDYLEFRFFLNGQRVEQIRIADVSASGIVPKPENFTRLQNLLVDFAAFQGQTIKSAKKLAEMMARKSALMRDVFFKAVTDESAGESSLKDQLAAFQAVLMHDMDAAQFADVYAQTIAYGLFTARLHENTVKDFSRAEALNLIPKSNPFLRQLFHYVAGPDLDDRVVWIIDALCEVYRAADLHEILKDFGVSTGQNDPILHFYETFLAAYDPTLRKSRGVWYTPEPVVRFIVRAIDDVLKSHFGLKEGLAHTGMVEIEVDAHAKGKSIKVKQQVHKVQLLDVATGTGTFLAEVVKQLYARFKGQEGMWSGYVEQNLLPRLHGFELLMASYAMCHMKLDLLLTETGYRPSNAANPPRLSVYLTNSLEEHHPDTGTLFASWLSREANEASRIKKDMPIMVAFGNPPYSVSSVNRGEWIQSLIADYKKNLNERKINLDDDYIKFIRYAEHYIERTGYGIVALITNNSFLDGVTHRQMRKHLLETFDTIYIYDLHGSTKKKESAPDGSKDENVFDIQQGVSISIFIKAQKESKRLADVYHADCYGLREHKYDCLRSRNIQTSGFSRILYERPYYFFVPKNFDLEVEYKKGFSITDVFIEYNSGIQSKRDAVTISFTESDAEFILQDFLALNEGEIRKKYGLPADGRDWSISWAKDDLSNNKPELSRINYRPFDNRLTYYTGKSKGFIAYPREKTMRHLMAEPGPMMLFCRQLSIQNYAHIFCCDEITDLNSVSINSKEQTYCAPLYLYEPLLKEKRANLNQKILSKLPDASPEKIFDYVYAVLYCRAYRRRYAEFLKIDFPRIPYPKDKKTFSALAAKGAALRELHLMESPTLDTLITTYPIGGDHEVVALRWEESKNKPGLGRVWINPTQYFDNVPLTAWNFYIGGYQPAQKWLKDRKGRKLTSDDLLHYQRIIVALTETDKVMNEIDRIDFLPNA